MYSFFANQSSGSQLDHEDLEQIDEFDLEEMDLKWQVAMISMRLKKFYIMTGRKLHFDANEPEEFKALVTLDGEGIDWTPHAEDEKENFALIDFSNSGSNTKVTSCSKECVESYTKLKKLYDEQREQLGDASIEIQAYTQALKKVEAQLVAYQQNQLWYEEKIRFMKIDLDDKTDVLTYHKKLLATAEKEKEELKTRLEKWQNSSKGLNKLLNSQMSVRDKVGLGYGDQIHEGILSYLNEVFQSVFNSRSSDTEDSPVNNRYAKGMHAIPPPMTRIYIPSRPDKEIDESQFTYGPKQSKPSESDTRSSDFNSCESNSSKETLEFMPEPVINEPKVVSQPKVWSNAPIIKEYESDSDDDCVSIPLKEQVQPKFFAFVNTNKHVKTSREIVKNQHTHSQSPKVNKKDLNGSMSKRVGLGYGFTRKVCFVCGSFSHLIRDCDYHEKRMAKQVGLNKKKVKSTVNTARASGTNNVNTTRQNPNGQVVPTSNVKKVNTVRPNVKDFRPRNNIYKSHSPFNKTFHKTTAPKANFVNQKVHTAGDKAVSAVEGIGKTAIKALTGCNWSSKRNYWTKDSKYNSRSYSRRNIHDGPQRALKNKGIIDSGCSRHMTGNKAYLVDYQDYNGGPVTFEGSKGYITGKGKGPTWLFDLDYLTDSMSYQPSSEAKKGGEKLNEDTGLKPNEEPIDQAHQIFLEELERLKRQEKEANDAAEALRKEFAQNTKDLLLQAGTARATSTNSVNTVSPPDSTASVFSTGGPSYPDQDDSQTSVLEDIYANPSNGIITNASYDDEGAVANFTNLETTVNASPIPTSRIHSIHPKTQILGDPTSAVQTKSKVNKTSRAHALVSYIQNQRRNNHKDFQHCLFACFLSQIEPKKISKALEDKSWVDAMQEELL
ncbi:hypothetical protein Tco_0615342 [Tanacetum coccineum]